ncbi:MAG: hypothetical protein F6K30_01340 [Cyanothece sp. SIO2G6]|nr:hypothetical protein [Cyanothece sp. SIO2G6]
MASWLHKGCYNCAIAMGGDRDARFKIGEANAMWDRGKIGEAIAMGGDRASRCKIGGAIRAPHKQADALTPKFSSK